MRDLFGYMGGRRAVALLIGVGGLAVWPCPPVHAANFLVNSPGEQSDAVPGDGVAEIQPGTGITTFHAAIEEANAFPGPDTISFGLDLNFSCECDSPAPCRVELKYTRPLPPLNDPTAGTTIQLESIYYFSGVNIDPELGEPGYNAALVILSAGNIVRNFNALGFPQDGINISGPDASGNTLEHCDIGAWCGLVDGVGRDAIRIDGGASANVVTDCTGADSIYGIHITGTGSDGNLVTGNYLGQRRRALVAACGVDIDEITNLTPLPLPPECGRSIHEAFLNGYLSGSAAPNATGAVGIDNGASGNIVGGEGRDLANFIGGSHWKSGIVRCGIMPRRAQGAVEGNQAGVILDGVGTTGNRIQGNYIGYRNVAVVIADQFGNVSLCPQRDMSGLTGYSVLVRNGATENVIGHESEPALGNKIRYGLKEGVVVDGSGTSDNVIANNEIDALRDGVVFQNGAQDNFLGAGGNGNKISAGEYGVELTGTGTTRNTVIGNLISENGFSGIAIRNGAAGNIIGGTTPALANEIARNFSDGVVIFDPGSNDNQILGNLIERNGEIGVFMVNGASNNVVGGTTPGSGNNIYDNAVTGVEIHDINSTGNRILGNEIHGNGTRGVFMVDGTSGNIVGGVPLAERNRIFENELSGIEINGANTFENQIRLNSIYDNGEKGILLTFGANKGIVPPVIETFVPFAGTAPPDSFVDIFSDAGEEGKTYIGSTTTDAEGNFSVALNLAPHVNTNLTSTATDSAGDTSEFSAPIAIVPPAFAVTPADRVVVEGDDFELPVNLTGSPTIRLQWRFRSAQGEYADLEDAGGVSGSETETLFIADADHAFEGYYQCVADNGLGGVNSREIFVRVVGEDLDELEVNTLTDGSDGNTSSFARLLAEPGADGVVSLREAIVAANTMAGPNSVRFSVEGVLQPHSPLPAISDSEGALTLDGMDALSLDGSLLGESGSGLTLTSAENHIKGLGVHSFPEHGIVISGSGATGNRVTGCHIGTDGETALGQGIHGILVADGASGNVIGGAVAGEGNHIAANQNAGIALSGANTSENLILGNTIGQGADGLPADGNVIAGVLINTGASDNRVGGDESGEANLITGNAGIGVWIVGDATARNSVLGNTIFGNGELGIRLFEGGNENVFRPEIATVSPLAGSAPPNSRVDCYVDDDDEGEDFLISLVADETGAFGAMLDLALFDGRYLTAIATDDAGNTSPFSRPAPIDFTPPVLQLTGAGKLTLECSAPFDDPGATASDNIDGNLNNQIVATIQDTSGTVLASLDGAAPGVYTLIYSVSDSSGLVAAPVSRTVVVEDTTAPTVTLNGAESLRLGCGEEFDDPGATAQDGCDSAPELQVAGTVDSAAPGDYTLSYSATDSSGNTSGAVIRTVTVEDRTPPVIVLNGAPSLGVVCGEVFSDPGATASDDCGGAVDVSVAGSVNINQTGEYTLTYRAEDGEGNQATAVTRTITVDDTTPPVLTLVGAAELVLQCGDGYAELGATIDDACDAVAEVVVTGDVDPNTIGVYNRHYDAIDASGNVAATLTRTISVEGQSPPRITLTGQAAITVACGGNYQDAGASAVDGCQSDIGHAIVTDNPVNTEVPGTYSVRYNVSDGTGTPAEEVTRTVTVLACATPCDATCTGEPNDQIDGDGDGLSACKEQCANSSDSDPDSDNDGMPDGFEYRHQLALRVNDADLDLDLDGLTNLEEYLEGGSPRNAATPVRSFYVSPNGVDASTAGTLEDPWQSLGYALARLESAPSGANQLFVDSGVYVEDISLLPGLVVRAMVDANVEIMGTVIAPAGSILRDVTLSSDGADTALLFITGGNVRISGCTFNGEFGTNLTGIVVEDRNPGLQSASPGVIEGCVFMNLATGISVDGVLPHVRQCQFINIGGAGIAVLPDVILGDNAIMGDGLNGWNDFSGIGEGIAIANQSAEAVSAQWNDWGTEDPVALEALIEGEVDQANALGAGGASSAAALEVVVFNGQSQARIRNARVSIVSGGTTLSGNTTTDGRVAFPALRAGTWQVTVTASGFPTVNENINLVAGIYRVANYPMLAEDVEEPIDEGCTAPAKTARSGESRRGDLVLLVLLFAFLFTGQIARMEGGK
ncbi:MAG: DUF5011 domain-containing protein [Candidatus Hydrogenedentes bacterium]|nr:DUF5011 domain-containing protein [Candidatus Hydrogenedentota bacterium]